jgi:hypothetical protein
VLIRRKICHAAYAWLRVTVIPQYLINRITTVTIICHVRAIYVGLNLVKHWISAVLPGLYPFIDRDALPPTNPSPSKLMRFPISLLKDARVLKSRTKKVEG